MFDFDDEDKDNPIGSLLRYHREQKKLDLERVSEELRIRLDYLEAMEEGLFGILPPGIYRRSFVKAYAEYLKLDADHLLEMLDDYEKTTGKPAKELPPVPKSQDQETSDEEKLMEEKPATPTYARPVQRPVRSRVGYGLSISLGLLIGAMCVIFLFRIGMEKQRSTPADQDLAEAESLIVIPEPPDTMQLFLDLLDQKIGSAPELVLRIQAAGRSWIQVFADGEELFTGFVSESMNAEFKFTDNLSINVGVNEGIKAFLNGLELTPLEKGVTRIDRANFRAYIPTDRANEIVRRFESNHESKSP